MGFVVRATLLLLLVLVPLRIVARGYLPDDDALRHAAKAVSGRPWSEILVLRPDVTMDSHPGWHAALGLVHRATGADVPTLVALSVVVGLLAVLLPPLFLLRRPEAWAAVLVVFGTLEPRIMNRFASGRPFLLSAGLLAALCLLAARSSGEVRFRRGLLVLAPVIALVAWMHPSWHLFLLPVAACLLAGCRRMAILLAAALGVGVLLAGLLYGHPVEFVVQSVWHTALAMGSPRRRAPSRSSSCPETARRCSSSAPPSCGSGARAAMPPRGTPGGGPFWSSPALAGCSAGSSSASGPTGASLRCSSGWRSRSRRRSRRRRPPTTGGGSWPRSSSARRPASR